MKKGERCVDRGVVLALHRSGLGTKAIAEQLGCSGATVRGIKREFGCIGKTGRAPWKTPRVFRCEWCHAKNSTTRDDKRFCNRRCCSQWLMHRRWNYDGRPPISAHILRRMYWKEGKSSPEIAKLLKMTHKGVLDAMRWAVRTLRSDKRRQKDPLPEVLN